MRGKGRGQIRLMSMSMPRMSLPKDSPLLNKREEGDSPLRNAARNLGVS